MAAYSIQYHTGTGHAGRATPDQLMETELLFSDARNQNHPTMPGAVQYIKLLGAKNTTAMGCLKNLDGRQATASANLRTTAKFCIM